MTKSATRADHRHYCLEMLRLNPAVDAPRILAMRRRALGLPPANPVAIWNWVRATPEQRAAMDAHLARLRQYFWTLPLPSLNEQLARINISQLPEFAAAVGKLRYVAACRSEFPRLVSDPQTDRALFGAFTSAVILGPAEAGPIKERFLRTLNDRDRYQSAMRTVHAIRSDYPVLYQLERDWFETILRIKKPRRAAAPAAAPQLHSAEWNIGDAARLLSPVMVGVLIFVVRIVFKLLAAQQR